MDTQEIINILDNDKKRRSSSYNRYPVRFLFLDITQNPENTLPELVSSNNGNLISLQDSLSYEDGWLTKSMIMNVVKKCSKTNDSFIVGLSEIIRFYSNGELESLILSLLGDIENDLSDSIQSQRRIYFVCFSMKEYLQDIIIKKFRRYDVYNPFLNPNFEYSYNINVFFLNEQLMTEETPNVLSTSKNWISLWKHARIIDFSKPIFCNSNTLYEWYEKISPDNAFQVEKINNYKELIRRLFSIDFKFEYCENDCLYWKTTYELLKQLQKPSLEKLVLQKCNLIFIDYYSAIERWASENDKYIQWLLFVYIYTYYNTNLGTSLILKYQNNKDAFFNELILYPYIQKNLSFNEERLCLLQKLAKYTDFEDYNLKLYNVIDSYIRTMLDYPSDIDVPYDINKITFNEITDENISKQIKHFIKYTFIPSFTGLFSSEKELIVSFYALSLLDLTQVKELYPAFYTYINGSRHIQDKQLDEYFIEYRKSKICGNNTSLLNTYINEFNKNDASFYKWYYKNVTQSEMLRGVTDPVFIIDGLGAEYFPYICDLLEKKEYTIAKSTVAYSHIPSITSVNKKFIYEVSKVDEWYTDFDSKVIHSDFYKTTRNIRKSLDMIESLISKIVNKEINSFIITADHGATGQGKWQKTEKRYNYSLADHEGRCLKVSDEKIKESDDYIYYQDSETSSSWCISLREISLYNNPRYEDHGGATPEEVVVPFIHAIKGIKNAVNFKVLIIKDKITGLDRTISFSISPRPNEVYLRDENNDKVELFENNSIWTAKLTTGKTQDVQLFYDGNVQKYHIENASAANMKGGNDGFDDFD